MNDAVSTILTTVFSLFLECVPYAVFATIMVVNFGLVRRQASSVRDDVRPTFAYLGGFLAFVIGFAMLQTNANFRQVSIEDSNSATTFVSLVLGTVVGGVFMFLASVGAKGNLLNWYIFLTNAAASSALMVYVFIEGLQKPLTFLMLGFLLGVILYLVNAGNFRKSIKSNNPLP